MEDWVNPDLKEEDFDPMGDPFLNWISEHSSPIPGSILYNLRDETQRLLTDLWEQGGYEESYLVAFVLQKIGREHPDYERDIASLRELLTDKVQRNFLFQELQHQQKIIERTWRVIQQRIRKEDGTILPE